jgi:hypothetical protein
MLYDYFGKQRRLYLKLPSRGTASTGSWLERTITQIQIQQAGNECTIGVKA